MRWALVVLGAIILGVVAFNLLFTTSACLLAGPGTDYPTIASAIEAVKPGCTVILLPGEYSSNLVITKQVRIIASSEAVLVSLPKSAIPAGTEPSLAVLNSIQKPVIIRPADPSRPAIEIRTDNVELQGLAIQGGSTGIAVSRAGHVRLIGNAISTSAHDGIALDGARESLVQDNTIMASGATGISLQDSSQIRVLGNRVDQAQRGITLQRSSANLIQGNRLSDLSAEGISLSGSSGNRLIQNDIEKSQRALLLTNSAGNKLQGNTLDQNRLGLRVWGDQPADFVEDIADDNIVNGRPIIYLVGAHDEQVDVSRRPALIALINSEKITVVGAAFNAQDEGILLVDTRQSTIRGNFLNGTLLGITLLDSRENEISENQIQNSAENGIWLLRSHGNKLTRNQVSGSAKHGVYLSQSASNELTQSVLSANKSSGAFLEAGQMNRVMENQLLDNWVGVFLERAGANTISDNLVKDNHFGIYVNQSSANEVKNNQLEGNQTDSNVVLPPEAPPNPSQSGGQGPASGGS